CADGFTRPIFLTAERRRVINRRAELIEDVIGVNADVVGSPSDDPRGELVAGQSLDFVRRRDGIRASFVTLRFAVFDREDRNVNRDVVTLEQIELEMNQLRLAALIRELEPVHAALG